MATSQYRSPSFRQAAMARRDAVRAAGRRIGVRSCEETEIAKKMIDNLLQQPDPAEPRPGAQLVGDLDG
jgi:hypothetical protein